MNEREELLQLRQQRDEISTYISLWFQNEPFDEKATLLDCIRHIANRLSMAEEQLRQFRKAQEITNN